MKINYTILCSALLISNIYIYLTFAEEHNADNTTQSTIDILSNIQGKKVTPQTHADTKSMPAAKLPSKEEEESSLTPEMLDLLKENNVDINSITAKKGNKVIADEKEQKAKEEAQEQQRILEEEKKKKEQQQKLADSILPKIIKRTPYSYAGLESSQVYKSAYGPNNSHLPRAIPDAKYSDYLFVAVAADDITAIKALLEKGADINAQIVDTLETPLIYATKMRKNQVMSYLITKGADLNITDNSGRSAIYYATENQDSEAYALLLYSGAEVPVINSPETTNNSEDFVLETASVNGNYDELLINSAEDDQDTLVQSALKHGANINTQDQNKNTALMWAAINGNTEMLRTILQYNPDIHMKNLQNKTGLDIALEQNNTEMIALLESANIRGHLE